MCFKNCFLPSRISLWKSWLTLDLRIGTFGIGKMILSEVASFSGVFAVSFRLYFRLPGATDPLLESQSGKQDG